jgi:hypothetical protein
MSYVPQPTSLDPIELAVWAAEFVRARYDNLPPTPRTIEQADYAVDTALKSAKAAVDDLRRAYKR